MISIHYLSYAWNVTKMFRNAAKLDYHIGRVPLVNFSLTTSDRTLEEKYQLKQLKECLSMWDEYNIVNTQTS